MLKKSDAAHLLEGPAATWWDNFQITTPIEDVTWAIFEDGFRTAHISSGVMSLKKKEFHNLKQRHRSVAEYIEEFNNLARYAPDEVDTDAKRKEKFLEGLNDDLNLQLAVAYVPTYQSLCDKAAILENKMKQSRVERGSTPTSTTRDRLTNDLTMMTAEAQDPTSMGNLTSTTTTTVMTTSIIAVMTMTSTRTTKVDIRATTVVMEVEVEVSLLRETSVRLNASTARRWDTMQMSAPKRKLKDLSSPILSRKDR